MTRNFKLPSILWLITGSILILFTRSSYYLPFAIIVAPIFLLLFIREQKAIRGIVLTLLGVFSAMKVESWGLPDFGNFPLAFTYNLIMCLSKAFVLSLPVMVDRLIYKKLKGFLSTLSFPVAATALYYSISKWSILHNGLGIHYSYTQYGNIVLMQIVSLAGIWGMIFLLSWISSTSVYLWERRHKLKAERRNILIFVSVIFILLVYGSIKTIPVLGNFEKKTVRIAAILHRQSEIKDDADLLEIFENRNFANLDIELPGIEMKVSKAVSGDAQIVAFQEYSLIIDESDNTRLENYLSQLAKDNNIFICFNYAYFPKLKEGEHEYSLGMIELTDEEEGRNRALFIDNRGNTLIDYYKQNLVLGEDNYILDIPNDLNVVNTEYGRIGVVICRDMSFPDFIHTAGKKKADILIAPSFESVKLPVISYNQMMRAVENGFSFVRPCANGLSIAIDYNGRVISQQSSFNSQSRIMFADVPVKGIFTIYRITGSSISWICIIALCTLLLYLIIKEWGPEKKDQIS